MQFVAISEEKTSTINYIHSPFLSRIIPEKVVVAVVGINHSASQIFPKILLSDYFFDLAAVRKKKHTYASSNALRISFRLARGSLWKFSSGLPGHLVMRIKNR